ncbi:lytic transglycosylase domain-containing protein [Acidiphilium multivorum]|uniref:lytic transglycosylase domain-containing protein n=1 Tax=Acidiphilium multivorum TaxID=62140 RepID=UPI001B8BDF94|nr:lytic transglycosylase domain-containing protein [Acidiphilium multivorum]MBS3025035.1 lytic transglycosylase domain-containing protein [Acidiphilium multivorum]
MALVALATACGLAAKAALFVPLHGSSPCQNLAKIARSGRNPRIAVWQPDIAAASRRFGVPEHWIAAVMRVESGGHLTLNGRPIRSSAGAMGLMQVMPRTYAELRTRYDLGANPYAPRNNIMAGTAYLREMFDRFGAPWFLAAYNAGPARLEQSLLAGHALPAQTQRYLAAVVARINESIGTPQVIESRAPAAIFAYQTATHLPSILRPSSAALNGLFVPKAEPTKQQARSNPTP